jgi:hypothetical protein
MQGHQDRQWNEDRGCCCRTDVGTRRHRCDRKRKDDQGDLLERSGPVLRPPNLARECGGDEDDPDDPVGEITHVRSRPGLVAGRKQPGHQVEHCQRGKTEDEREERRH